MEDKFNMFADINEVMLVPSISLKGWLIVNQTKKAQLSLRLFN
jgi:hypothetical protein